MSEPFVDSHNLAFSLTSDMKMRLENADTFISFIMGQSEQYERTDTAKVSQTNHIRLALEGEQDPFTYTINGVGSSRYVGRGGENLSAFPLNMSRAFELIRDIYELNLTELLQEAMEQHSYFPIGGSIVIEKKENISKMKDGMTLGGSAAASKANAIAKYGEDAINTSSITYKVITLNCNGNHTCPVCWGKGILNELLRIGSRKIWTDIACPSCAPLTRGEGTIAYYPPQVIE